MSLILFELDNRVLNVALNRVSALNAVNSDLLKELEAGLKTHAENPNLAALRLYGSGGCFSAGADIKELAFLNEQGIRSFHALRERTFARLEHFPAPTIAVIEKFALGSGLELALCCDFRIAADTAKLGVPSAKLGIVESYEYLARLIRAIGPFQAKKIVFTAEKVDAKAALSMGLVEEIVPPDDLFTRAAMILERVSKNSIYSIRQSKKVLGECARDPNLAEDRDTADPMVKSIKTADFKQGVQSFLDRRQTKFK